MVRAFTAVDIEDDEVLDELEEVQKQIDLGFKLVERDKMHITFQFFKDISEDELEELKSAMKSVELDSFNLNITGLGVFPSEEYMRVLWAGADQEEMHDLYKQLKDHDVEVSTENSFKPHITLARLGELSEEKRRKVERVLKEYKEHEFGTVEVDEIRLYESSLKPEGSVYRQLYSVEL